MNVFLDTNVLLDVLADRKPHAAASAVVWSLADRGDLRAFMSAISFNNLFYILRKANGRAKAKAALREVRQIFETVPLTVSVIDRAIAEDLGDFEDAIQYVSAVEVSANYLITRNAGDFPDDGDVEIVSPEELLAILSASEPPSSSSS